MNNPLMYSDPSGEIFFAAIIAWVVSHAAAIGTAALIGAGIGLASYTLGVALAGQQWQLGGALKSMFWGAVSGAVTFGIGSIFSVVKDGVQVATAFAEALGKVGTAFVQAGAHAVAQGALSLMQGGTFSQAFWSGALGSLGASAFGAVAGKVASSTVGTIAFGAVAGGIGAELTGGNFWQGALIGGVVAGLNHAMHKMDSSFIDDGDPPGKKSTTNATDKKTSNQLRNGVKSAGDIVSTSDDALSMALELKGGVFKTTLKPFTKTLGSLNIGFSIGMGGFDVMDYYNGGMSGERLGFNLTSYATPIVVGSELGGFAGFLSGMAFTAAHMWHGIFVNQINPILTRVNTSNPYWIYNYR